jgi:hypothetical protein
VSSALRGAEPAQGTDEWRDLVPPKEFFTLSDLAQGAERIGHSRIELFLEQRHEFVTEPVACKTKISVTGILTPGLAALPKMFFNLAPRDSQHRPDNCATYLPGGIPDIQRGADSCQTFQPRPADDVHHHGFSLIIEGMAGGDFIQSSLADEAVEVAIAGLAGRVFEPFSGFDCFPGDICAADVNLKSVAVGQYFYESLVGIGFGTAQAVIEVDDGKNNSQFRAQLQEQVQEGDRVCAGGDGCADAVSRLQELVAADAGKKSLGELGHGIMVHLRGWRTG